jgi:ABC-2 type transport system permease protein
MTRYWRAFYAVLWREALRFLQQRERLLAALVRPLIWLVVFAAGFRAILGISIQPPYQTYITYDVYIVPGLIGMIQLFNGMQSSLSMVYDREMGSMRVLLTTPLPRWFVLLAKLVAGAVVSLFQVYAFLLAAALFGITFNLLGYALVLPALLLTGIMVGAFGMFVSSLIRQLENFAGVMNFVIFPLFFFSSALYPLWRMRESSVALYRICLWNPFTHAVEAIRFALYEMAEPRALLTVLGATALFVTAALIGYSPSRGMRSPAEPPSP